RGQRFVRTGAQRPVVLGAPGSAAALGVTLDGSVRGAVSCWPAGPCRPAAGSERAAAVAECLRMTLLEPASSGLASSDRGGATRSHLPFCCPLCKGQLGTQHGRYRCARCARDYPVVLGIADFRVFPDPYIDYAADHAKAERLAGDASGRTFAQLVERYWELTPDVPRQLARRYVRHVLAGVERGQSSLATIER